MLVAPLGSPVLEEVAADHSSILELPSSMSLVSSLIFAFNFSSLAFAVLILKLILTNLVASGW
jgi:hypothetical protein